MGEFDFGVLMKNYLDMIIEPIENFLDNMIDNGNHWYVIIGAIALVLYFVVKKLFF